MASRRFNAACQLQLTSAGGDERWCGFLAEWAQFKQTNKKIYMGENELKTLWCAHQLLSPEAAHLDVYHCIKEQNESVNNKGVSGM